MTMPILTTRLDDELLVTVEGQLDGALAPGLHAALEAGLASGVRTFVIDLAAVPVIDGGGIAVIAAIAHQLEHLPGRLVLQLPGGRTVEVPGAGDVRRALAP
jgi:anti-anti-sigma factor